MGPATALFSTGDFGKQHDDMVEFATGAAVARAIFAKRLGERDIVLGARDDESNLYRISLAELVSVGVVLERHGVRLHGGIA